MGQAKSEQSDAGILCHSPTDNKFTLSRVEPEPGVQVDVKCDLLLHRSLEWRLSAFFRCVGLMRKGEPFAMDWDAIIGARGYGHFKPKSYTGNDGKTHKVNACDKFYDYDDNNFTQTAPPSPVEDGCVTVNDDLDLPF